MKITEKQLLILVRILEGTLRLYDDKTDNLFAYDAKTRETLYNQIINQQSDEIIDVKE